MLGAELGLTDKSEARALLIAAQHSLRRCLEQAEFSVATVRGFLEDAS